MRNRGSFFPEGGKDPWDDEEKEKSSSCHCGLIGASKGPEEHGNTGHDDTKRDDLRKEGFPSE